MSLGDLLREKLRSVVSACARDPELRARVKADPKTALAEEGVDLPFDEARVVEDTPETTHIALTAPNAELSDEQMETAVGGVGWSYAEAHEQVRQTNRMADLHGLQRRS